MHITPVTPVMFQPVAHLIHAAFAASAHGDSGEADLVAALLAEQAVITELVATTQDSVQGHVLLSRARIHQVFGAVLAPLSVHPDWQRQGIGAALVQAVFPLAQQAGAAFISVLGDPAYYQRFGFRPAARWGVTAPMPVPESAFLLKVFTKDLPQGPLQYAQAFGL